MFLDSLAISLQIHESRQLLKSLRTLGGAQMAYFEVLMESFEDITENWWQNRASWEHRWCRLLPWAAAACQGHSKMVISSSLALPLPAPREIRFAAAREGLRMCETGASCLWRPQLLPGDLPSGSRSRLRWDVWGHDLRGCFFLAYTDIILTNPGGLFKSCKIHSLCECG